MKKSDIYEVAFKIFGLYLVILAIRLLRDVFYSFSLFSLWKSLSEAPNPVIHIVLSIAHFAVILSLSLLLIFRTKKIVKILCDPIDFEESTRLFMAKKNIYEITLIIISLVLIMSALPELTINIKNSMFPGETYKISSLAISAGKILIAFFTIIWAKEIGNRLARIKIDKIKNKDRV